MPGRWIVTAFAPDRNSPASGKRAAASAAPELLDSKATADSRSEGLGAICADLIRRPDLSVYLIVPMGQPGRNFDNSPVLSLCRADVNMVTVTLTR